VTDILYLIYSNKHKSIIFYNLIDFKKINEIKKAHHKYIINFRHYLDKQNKRDLIISVSKDNNIKLWNVNNYECLYNFTNINKNGNILSACFLNDNNQIFIVTSNYTEKSYPDPIKVFDFNGNQIKKINKSNELTVFIDTYYDDIKSRNYIITGNFDFARSFDYNKNKIYHRYFDYIDFSSNIRFSLIIYKTEKIIKLIESSLDGNIRIWNFHSAELLNKIKVCKYLLSYGINLWNDTFLFIGCEDGTITLLNIDNKEIITNLSSEDTTKLLSLKSIIHPLYGKCLISQSNEIKLWINKI
jgi:WD40 repeat protein